MTTIAAPELLTSAEAAEVLGISERRLRELAEQGEIAYVRFGERGRYRFPADELRRLLEPRRGAA